MSHQQMDQEKLGPPDIRHFTSNLGTPNERDLFEYLLEFLTPQRTERLCEVLSQRTRRLTLVLEDICHPHNMNAVLRSCDAFGLQDVSLIEEVNDFDPSLQRCTDRQARRASNTNRFKAANTITRGAHRWLTLHRYTGADSRPECIKSLRARGYRIVATSPHSGAYRPDTLPLDQPTAIVLGNEHLGVSEELQAVADDFLYIPMVGFSESLNISVAAAVCMEQLTRRMRELRTDWPIPAEDQSSLMYEWVRKSVRHLPALELRFRQEQREIKENSASQLSTEHE